MADPTTPKRERIRRPVSPEIAANVREEDEAYAATKRTAEAIANAAISAASTAVERQDAIRNAALRPILRALELDDATIVGVEGFGPDTVLIIELPSAAPAEEKTDA